MPKSRPATTETTPPRRGRPPVAVKVHTPARQLGRVSDEDWAVLQQAATASGMTFTAWAVSVLMRAAKRIQK